MKRIGVDVGGTFTDLILVDEESGRVTVDKVASTPDDPAKGVIDGVREICGKAEVALSDVDNLSPSTLTIFSMEQRWERTSCSLTTGQTSE